MSSSMKRLFKVTGNDKFDTAYFESKTEAKKLRDERIEAGFKSCHVSKGPDHRLFGIKRTSGVHPKKRGKKS